VAERPGQKSIVLILARELASKLSTAAFVTDERGALVYYNEAAEELLGRTLAETAALPARDWRALFSAERLDGTPMPVDEMPGMIALGGRPAHDELCVTAGDGARRRLLVTALPLFAHADEVVGVLIVFWAQRAS
jgi:PAS domain-containing protein